MCKQKLSILSLAVAATAFGVPPLMAQNRPNDVQSQQMQRTDRAPMNNEMGNNLSAQALKLPAGFTTKDVNDTDDIRAKLASITTNAVTRHKIDNIPSDLAKQDKSRISDDYAKLGFNAFDQRIDQFREAWKTKYGKDFDIDKNAFTSGLVAIVTGEVSDPAVALNNWPVAASATEAMKASQTQQPMSDRQAEKDAKLDKGRNVALVRLPGSGMMSGLTISMLHELPDQWTVDVPNDRSGSQIYNDLLTQLTYLSSHTDQLPADANEGYRIVAYRVLSALYGTESQPGNMAQ